MRRTLDQLVRATTKCLLAALILPFALTGCAGALRTETIIIPDTAEEVPATPGGDAFEVETLYRLPAADEELKGLFRWTEGGDLLRLSWNFKGGAYIERYGAPYEKAERDRELGSYLIDFGSLSPDGRYFTGIAYGDDMDKKSELTLMSLEDGSKEELGAVRSFLQLGARTIPWSANSRYFSYITVSGQGGLNIEAYDTETGALNSYKMEETYGTAFYYSVKLSDDGGSAIVVKEEKGQPLTFELGKLSNGQFTVQYKHTLHENRAVDWLDDYRVAFTGTDGTLFAHDLRNDGYAVLLDQVGSFALSGDREFIAYTTPDATVEVAKLQGNNLLHKKTVYRGIVATELSWSPDGGSLLIQGRKPYESAAAAPKPAQEAEPADDTNAQIIVIDFRS